jgi:uncharacterized protein (TIGR00251 family)
VAEILVRVIPRAKKTETAGFRGDALVIRLAAPPVDGAANDALIAFLATTLHVPRSAIHIVSGERGRLKRIRINGASEDRLRALLS